MNQDRVNSLQASLTQTGRLLLPFVVIWFLGAIGLGWLVKSFFILLAFIILAPIVAFLGLRWWVSRNLVQSSCPVCGYEFMSLNQSEFQCPSCNEALTARDGRFERLTPPGTIDITAVEVQAQPGDE